MTNIEYKEMLEKKYGKALKEIMYDLCVEQRVDQYEGAKILGVPKDTFVAWRTKFGYGPIQLQVANAKKRREVEVRTYHEELQDVDLARPFQLQNEVSLIGFKEVLQRKLELCKVKRVLSDPAHMGEMVIQLEIGVIESALQLLDSYMEGEYQERFLREAKWVLAVQHPKS